jgi:hypothetical protein
MSEESNSPEKSTPPEEPTEFAEAEWSDDSAYDSLEQPPEESDTTISPSEADHDDGIEDEGLDTSAVDSTDEMTAAATAAAMVEEEWSDDSAYDSLETAMPSADASDDTATTDTGTTEEWDEATFEWDEELAEPPETPPTPPTTQDALSWLKPSWRKFRRFWQRLLAGLRNRIPAIANLPDVVLSSIIVGTLALLLIVLNSVRQPATADSPPNPTPKPEQTTSPVASSPDAVDVGDAPAPAVAPDEPAMISAPAPVVVDSDRIAKIQSQLTDSSILNAQRVVDSVQADFQRNQLTLIFNGDWYRLSDYDQTQLTQALMQQSQELEFEEIQCLTPDGELLARSPVVGSNMVILQRERPPEVPEPERPRFRIMVDR